MSGFLPSLTVNTDLTLKKELVEVKVTYYKIFNFSFSLLLMGQTVSREIQAAPHPVWIECPLSPPQQFGG